MSNLSSYFGLVDEKIRASDKDLPVQLMMKINLFNAQCVMSDLDSNKI